MGDSSLVLMTAVKPAINRIMWRIKQPNCFDNVGRVKCKPNVNLNMGSFTCLMLLYFINDFMI